MSSHTLERSCERQTFSSDNPLQTNPVLHSIVWGSNYKEVKSFIYFDSKKCSFNESYDSAIYHAGIIDIQQEFKSKTLFDNVKFINSLRLRDNNDEIFEAMQSIYAKVNELTQIGDFYSIDNLILLFIRERFSLQLHVSFLTVARNISSSISLYSKLLESAKSSGSSYPSEAVEKTLKGF